MSKYVRDNSKPFIPPPIELFKKFGNGLLWRAHLLTEDLARNFQSAERWLDEVDDGTWKIGSHSPNLVALYAYSFEAEDMVSCLQHMPDKELEKHVRLDGGVDDIPELAKKLDELQGFIMGWEERHPALIKETLNRQMKDRLDKWSRNLDWAEEEPGRPYIEDEGEPMESISDFAYDRGHLEYFRLAIRDVQHVMAYEEIESIEKHNKSVMPRLYGVDIDGFEKRLFALDERFRKVLGNRRAEKPFFWTDPTFWWDHPPTKARH